MIGMMQHEGGRRESYSRQRVAAGLHYAGCLLVIMTLSGCATLFSSEDVQDVEDPALSEDPAIAGQLSSSGLPSQWTWSDAEQRWHYLTPNLQAPKVAMDGWAYEPAAIQLRVIAAPQLNQYHNRPHSLVLRVVQLADKKPFDDRRTTSFGLQEMLTVDAFDPTAVLSVNEYSLLPGADQMISLDRQQNVRYIGVVAGFYNLDGRRSSRLIPIPPIDDTPVDSGWLHSLTFGWLGTTSEAVPPRPAKLKLLLHLGFDQIDELKVSAE